MSIRKWQIMDFIWDDREITAYELVDEFNISIENARMMLLRAHKQGWLLRRKIREQGTLVYAYRLSDKAWRFFDEYGSFINHKWFATGIKMTPDVFKKLRWLAEQRGTDIEMIISECIKDNGGIRGINLD